MFRTLFLRMTLVVFGAVLFGIFAGCAKGERRDETAIPPSTTMSDSLAAPNVDSTITIRGALSYRERMAFPPGARTIVELREGTIEGPVKEWKNLDGQQIPLSFELTVPRASLSAGQNYVVRGSVFTGGLPAWVSDAVTIDLAQGDKIDLGTILMTRPAPGAYKMSMRCGDDTVVVGFSKTAMLLTVSGETFEMTPIASASGSKYEAVGDPTTTFWSKGAQTTITVKGRTLPECGRSNPAPAHEDTVATAPASPRAAGSKTLGGAEWVVKDIAGVKLIASSRVTLNFSADNKVSGKASCNSYSAGYTLSGDTIRVSQPVATMMMCEMLMDQEKSFLDLLQHTNRFEIAPDGSLILHASDGRKLTARR